MGDHIYPKEDEKKYYGFILSYGQSVCKLGKDPIFHSIRDKTESVQISVLLKVAHSPGMQRHGNTALEIDPGCPLVIAGEEDFYIINVLKPGLGDYVCCLLIHIL